MVKSKLDGLSSQNMQARVDQCCSSLLGQLNRNDTLDKDDLLWQLEELLGKEYLVHLKISNNLELECEDVEFLNGLIEKSQKGE